MSLFVSHLWFCLHVFDCFVCVFALLYVFVFVSFVRFVVCGCVCV